MRWRPRFTILQVAVATAVIALYIGIIRFAVVLDVPVLSDPLFGFVCAFFLFLPVGVPLARFLGRQLGYKEGPDCGVFIAIVMFPVLYFVVRYIIVPLIFPGEEVYC